MPGATWRCWTARRNATSARWGEFLERSCPRGWCLPLPDGHSDGHGAPGARDQEADPEEAQSHQEIAGRLRRSSRIRIDGGVIHHAERASPRQLVSIDLKHIGPGGEILRRNVESRAHTAQMRVGIDQEIAIEIHPGCTGGPDAESPGVAIGIGQREYV